MRLSREFTAAGIFTRRQIRILDDEVKAQMEAALRFALDSPWPDGEEALQDIWPS